MFSPFGKANMVIDTFAFKITGDEKNASFEAAAKGRYPDPEKLDFQATGEVVRAKTRNQLRLKTFKGQVGGRSFRLIEPFAIQ